MSNWKSCLCLALQKRVMSVIQVGMLLPGSFAFLFGVLPFSLDTVPAPGAAPLAVWCSVTAACLELQPCDMV